MTVGGGEPFIKMLAPLLLRFWSEGVLKLFFTKDGSLTLLINKSITKVFVEHPRLDQVC